MKFRMLLILTDMIKMKSNQVSTIPDMLNIETGIYCKSNVKHKD